MTAWADYLILPKLGAWGLLLLTLGFVGITVAFVIDLVPWFQNWDARIAKKAKKDKKLRAQKEKGRLIREFANLIKSVNKKNKKKDIKDIFDLDTITKDSEDVVSVGLANPLPLPPDTRWRVARRRIALGATELNRRKWLPNCLWYCVVRCLGFSVVVKKNLK